jgi:hypothetical protein
MYGGIKLINELGVFIRIKNNLQVIVVLND